MTQRVNSSPKFNTTPKVISPSTPIYNITPNVKHSPMLSDKLMMRTNKRIKSRPLFISQLSNKSTMTMTQRVYPRTYPNIKRNVVVKPIFPKKTTRIKTQKVKPVVNTKHIVLNSHSKVTNLKKKSPANIMRKVFVTPIRSEKTIIRRSQRRNSVSNIKDKVSTSKTTLDNGKGKKMKSIKEGKKITTLKKTQRTKPLFHLKKKVLNVQSISKKTKKMNIPVSNISRKVIVTPIQWKKTIIRKNQRRNPVNNIKSKVTKSRSTFDNGKVKKIQLIKQGTKIKRKLVNTQLTRRSSRIFCLKKKEQFQTIFHPIHP